MVPFGGDDNSYLNNHGTSFDLSYLWFTLLAHVDQSKHSYNFYIEIHSSHAMVVLRNPTHILVLDFLHPYMASEMVHKLVHILVLSIFVSKQRLHLLNLVPVNLPFFLLHHQSQGLSN